MSRSGNWGRLLAVATPILILLGVIAATQLANDDSVERTTIVYSVPIELEAFDVLAGWMEDELDDDYNFVYQISDGDPAEQTLQLRALAERPDVAAVHVTPIDTTVLANTGPILDAAGIPVVVSSNWPEDYQAELGIDAFVGIDEHAVGQDLAREIDRRNLNSPTILMLDGTTLNDAYVQRSAGFAEQAEAYDSWQVTHANFTQDNQLEDVDTLISGEFANQQFDVVVAPGYSVCEAVAAALDRQEIDTILICAEMNRSVLELMKSGHVQATTWNDPRETIHLSAQTLEAAAQGEEFDPRVIVPHYVTFDPDDPDVYLPPW